MKELTIEEKAKRYDEAIKKAGSLYKTAEPMSGCNVLLETVFPELAESEDEKIRKALINGFNKLDKSAVWYNGITNGQILAWLEKQGKSALEAAKEEKVDNQNCVKSYAQEHIGDAIEPKFKVGDKVIGIISGMQYYITEVRDNHYCTESGCIIMFCAQDNFELVEQQLKKIEQKPTDEEMKTLLQTEYEKGKADAIAEMQKPWSEEDESWFREIELMCLYFSDDIDYRGKFSTWLKSLKDRVQPQQEKEEILKKLEEWLDEYISNLADVGTDTLIGSFRKYLDGKLPVKPQNRWKPSDRDIKLLRELSDGKICPDNYRTRLYEIINNLKFL